MAIIETVHKAQEGLQKLKIKYIYANAYIEEIKVMHRDLKNELEKLDPKIKCIEQNLASDASHDQLRLLMDGKTRLDGVTKALDDFDFFINRNRPQLPENKFDEFMQKLKSIEEHSDDSRIDEKQRIKDMEEISKYSNTCINFVDFYVRSKSKLDAMLKLLKELNQTFEPKNQSWGEWIKSLIKASVTPAFNATVYFFTSQLLKYLFSA